MKRRVLGIALGLLIAAGLGRPGAAYAAYSRPACIPTYEQQRPLKIEWRHNGAGTEEGRRVTAERLLLGDTMLTVTDVGEGDHWSVLVKDGLTGEESWRKEGLGPLEEASIPTSVFGAGGLFEIEMIRFLKDGRTTSSSTHVHLADRQSYERLRGHSYALAEWLTYSLSAEGAVAARLTLRGADQKVRLSTLLDPISGVMVNDRQRPFVQLLNGQPLIYLPLGRYLDRSDIGKQLWATWEQLDSAGRTLATEAEPVGFTIRAPLTMPTWKQGGGQVISPTGTIEWAPVEGARWYRLSVADQAAGESALEVILPADQTQYQFSGQLGPGEYWVALAAEGGGCRQDWADSLRLVVDDQPGVGILSPQQDAVVGSDLSVKLRRAPWIHGYQVDLLDAQTKELLESKPFYRSQRGDTISFDTKRLVPGRTYRLRATATLSVPVPQVDEVTFTYQPPVRLGFKEALQGARLAKADLPLSWDAIPGAQSYTLLLTKVGGFVNLQTRHPVGTSTSATLPGTELESGRTYRLALEVTMADGSKRTADPVTFTVQ